MRIAMSRISSSVSFILGVNAAEAVGLGKIVVGVNVPREGSVTIGGLVGLIEATIVAIFLKEEAIALAVGEPRNVPEGQSNLVQVGQSNLNPAVAWIRVEGVDGLVFHREKIVGEKLKKVKLQKEGRRIPLTAPLRSIRPKSSAQRGRRRSVCPDS